MKPLSTFWERLVLAFENATPSEISERLPFSRAGLYKWRSGDSLPDGQTLLLISNKTGVSLHWLLTGEGEMRTGETTTAARPTIEELIEAIARKVARQEIESVLFSGQLQSNVKEAKEVKGTVRVPTLILKEE
jgi:transcriptional regulator with XRE-family HTH domain